MGGLSRFQVFLDNSVYCSGQTISGYLEIELSAPKKLRGIKIKFKGEANVRWSEKRNKRRVTYSARETYFSSESYVMGGSDQELTLPIGKHVFPFTFVLQPGLPSSFEGDHGHVRYSVRAVMDRPWRFDHEAKALFTVIQHLDLNMEPGVKESVERSSEKYLCCLCCRSGPIHLDATADFTGCVPGQEIPITVSVDNATNKSVEISENLYQVVSFHATMRTRRREHKICEASIGTVNSHGSGSWSHRLKIPSVPPSYLRNCSIIDISYKLSVKAHIGGPHVSLTVDVPLVIGTIPLVGYLPSSGSSARLGFGEAQLPGSGKEPSAPLLETPVPSQYPEMSPPTYEECMQGKKSVREHDDSEYVSGDMEFAPRYPMYQFN